jgi:phosphoribosylglycinamide formyltransferase 1
MTTRLVVLASGNGSNLQAIIDACASNTIDAEVVAVVSDRPDARALIRAIDAGIPAIPLAKLNSESRAAYDARLADAVALFAPHWVVLGGWMRLLGMSFLGRFPNRVLNVHPALPGQFPGTHAIERAHAAAGEGSVHQTGVMVHLVPDEGVDNGPVLAWRALDIAPGEPLNDLEARVHIVEHELLVQVLSDLSDTRKIRSA